MKTLVFLLPLLSIGILQAQPFTIDRATLAPGALQSAGGSFVLSGTLGQPEAGPATGGSYALTGGFWFSPGNDSQISPAISVFLSGTTLVLTWPDNLPGYVLQHSPFAAGSWVDHSAPIISTSGQKQVLIPIVADTRFYRLRKASP